MEPKRPLSGAVGREYHIAVVERYAGRIAALEAAIAERDELIRWLAQTVHQAHHDGPIEQCPKDTCSAIRALRERETGR